MMLEPRFAVFFVTVEALESQIFAPLYSTSQPSRSRLLDGHGWVRSCARFSSVSRIPSSVRIMLTQQRQVAGCGGSSPDNHYQSTNVSIA